MSEEAKKHELEELNEAISTYQILLADAIDRGDKEEEKFLHSQIQLNKRRKISLKKGEEFKPSIEETLYFALMGE